jgi:rhomboid protease GluP
MNLPRPFLRLPLVSFLLILVNVLLFVFELTRGVSALKPTSADMIGWGANVAALTLNGEGWRLLSSMFLHIGLIHIAFNMYMLFAFGPLVEDRFGSARFTLVYFLSGLFGSLVSAEWHAAQGGQIVVVAAGASGALMGISGAYVGHWLVARGRAGMQEELNMGPLAQTIGLNLILGFINPGVDNACHVGGLISGVVLGSSFALGSFEHSKLKRVAASTLISLVSLGLVYGVLQR